MVNRDLCAPARSVLRKDSASAVLAEHRTKDGRFDITPYKQAPCPVALYARFGNVDINLRRAGRGVHGDTVPSAVCNRRVIDLEKASAGASVLDAVPGSPVLPGHQAIR